MEDRHIHLNLAAFREIVQPDAILGDSFWRGEMEPGRKVDKFGGLQLEGRIAPPGLSSNRVAAGGFQRAFRVAGWISPKPRQF